MSALNTLKLVAVVKQAAINPVLQRRAKLMAKLVEQGQMAAALSEGAAYAPMRSKRVKDAVGNVSVVQTPKRVKAWWFAAEGGKLCLTVRYGSRTLELARGKAAVEVAGFKDLVGVLATLKKATEAGELDAQLEAVGVAMKKAFKK